jgi:2'-5' RNA ligase
MDASEAKFEERKARAFRLFVAISPPEAVKDEIEKAQRQLGDALPGKFVRWTKREQFHLTFAFLGDVAEARVAELIEALRNVCRNFLPLRLRAERIGFFPDTRYPRVVWAGVQDEKGVLERLHEAVAAALEFLITENAVQPGSAGVPPARRQRSQDEAFIGHITVGRIQDLKRPEAEVLAKLALGMTTRFFGEWVADNVELIRSELSSGGSRYTTLATIPFSGAP